MGDAGGACAFILPPSGHLPLDDIGGQFNLQRLRAGELVLQRDNHGNSSHTLEQIASLMPLENNGSSPQAPLLITGTSTTPQAPLLITGTSTTPQAPLLTGSVLEESVMRVCLDVQTMLKEKLSRIAWEESDNKALFPSSRQAMCCLKEQPCMLWEGVGTGLVEPDERLVQSMKPSQVTVLMAPSGSGKTRSLIELASQHWSLFFVGCRPLVGFGCGSSDVTCCAEILMDLLPRRRADKLSPEHSFVVKAGVTALILSRLTLLKTMKALRPALTPKEWAFFQLEFPEDFSSRLVTSLLALAQRDDLNVLRLDDALSNSLSRLLRELNWSNGMIVLDEAQALWECMPGVFASRLTPEKGQGLLIPLVVSLCTKTRELRGPLFISGIGTSMRAVRQCMVSRGTMKQPDVGEVYRLRGFDEENIKPFLERFIDTRQLDMNAITGTYTGRRRLLATAVERFVVQASPGQGWFLDFAFDMVLKSGVRSLCDEAKRLWGCVEAKSFVQSLLFTYYLSGLGYVITPSLRSTLTLVDCGFAMLLDGDKDFAPIVPLIKSVCGENIVDTKKVIMEEPLMVYALWHHMERGTLLDIPGSTSSGGKNYETFVMAVGSMELAFNNKVLTSVFGVESAHAVYNRSYKVLKSRGFSGALIRQVQKGEQLDQWMDAVEKGTGFETYAHTGALKGASGPDIIFMLEDEQGRKLPVLVQLRTSVNVKVTQAFCTVDVDLFGSQKLRGWCSGGYVRLVITSQVHKRQLAFVETRRSPRSKSASQVPPLLGLWAGKRIAGIMNEDLHGLEEVNRNIKRRLS